jgi:hypothetical protein
MDDGARIHQRARQRITAAVHAGIGLADDLDGFALRA